MLPFIDCVQSTNSTEKVHNLCPTEAARYKMPYRQLHCTLQTPCSSVQIRLIEIKTAELADAMIINYVEG